MNTVGRRWLAGSLGALLVVTSLLAGHALSNDAKPFRVCADPDNLPFSNQQQQGFENKIAELVARELGAPLSYYWWPHQRGLVRNTLRADQCDVLIGIPKGYDPVLWTKPYYRSAYVIAYHEKSGRQITTLDAPALRQLRIGVHRNTPPEEALARRGILDNVVGYSLFYDPRGPTSERPSKLVTDLVVGTIDVAVAWGPLVGYFAKKLNVPLELVPLTGDPGVPLAFDISMGVKKGDQALKTRLEDVLDRRRVDIRKVLEDYGVPLLPADAPGTKGAGG
ncbi:MAG TPA: substrate-binding domain-containing protein [Methylomirabilota bacterium]|nr:substrate-binding domain-containing protein [Methylomirabilota bacterium]